MGSGPWPPERWVENGILMTKDGPVKQQFHPLALVPDPIDSDRRIAVKFIRKIANKFGYDLKKIVKRKMQ